MKNALNNEVGMLGAMFLWLVANLKQGVIYFIKQALPPNKSAGSVVKFIDISQNFVAFSEYMKFKKDLQLLGCQSNDKALTKLRICQK